MTSRKSKSKVPFKQGQKIFAFESYDEAPKDVRVVEFRFVDDDEWIQAANEQYEAERFEIACSFATRKEALQALLARVEEKARDVAEGFAANIAALKSALDFVDKPRFQHPALKGDFTEEFRNDDSGEVRVRSLDHPEVIAWVLAKDLTEVK